MANTFIYRLKQASLQELLYRTKHVIGNYWLRWQIKKGINPVRELEWETFSVSNLKAPTIVGVPEEKLVEEILDGKTFMLNASENSVAAFNEARKTGFFEDMVNTGNIDIRSVWEPARLQHLNLLLRYATAYPASIHGRKAEVKGVESCVDWIRHNPFLTGPHYASAMECGLRILVFFFCLQKADQGSAEYVLIARAIFQHAWWISKRVSLYASLGNHTVCESVGLVFAGVIFYETTEGKKWLRNGITLLENELKHQVSQDGGPAEQSFSYHRFILDLYALTIEFLELNALYDCTHWKERTALGEAFIAIAENTYLDRVGDADGGHALGIGLYPNRKTITPSCNIFNIFTVSGYTFIKLGEDGYLLFDHGPLGMPPLYNHGHADALSVVVSKQGREILVDPGTYRYNTVPEWRQYFKGTTAHNTVTVDDDDQAIQETGFIWSAPYNAELVRVDISKTGIVIEGMHDGYKRLQEPVVHRRVVSVSNNGNRLEIHDYFDGDGVHDFSIHYHLHPSAELENRGSFWCIENDGVRVELRIEGGNLQAVRGNHQPILGWYSSEYGKKVETWTLSAHERCLASKHSFLTVLEFK